MRTIFLPPADLRYEIQTICEIMVSAIQHRYKFIPTLEMSAKIRKAGHVGKNIMVMFD